MSIPSEEVIIRAIAHDIRREILRIVKNEPRTFTELLNHFDISTGKLNYHLTQIKGFIVKNDESRYEVTSLGTRAMEILDLINRETPETDQPLLKQAYVSQKDTTKPLILQGINISIGMVCFAMIIHIIIAILALPDPNTPFFVSLILLLLFVGEIIILIWLIQIRRSTPAFLERFIKHLSETE
ncbi:MAG: winged helix-turn-helix domain-containing protein [Candidatus Hodarchaeota archaeon]